MIETIAFLAVVLMLAGLMVYFRREDRALIDEIRRGDRDAREGIENGLRDLAELQCKATADLTERVLAAFVAERAHVERVIAVAKAGSYAETQPGYMESMAKQAEVAARASSGAPDPMNEAIDAIGRDADRDLEQRFGSGNLPDPEGDA